MREIKFRGKRKDNNEWIYGFLWKSIDPCKEKTEYRGSFIQTGTNIDIWYEVYPESVGEYAGLPDKNVKEIFEGDVINYSCAEYHDPEISCTPDVIDSGQGEIYYLKSAYEIKGAEFPPDCYELEIIGNIYENPDIYKSGSIRNEQKNNYA